MPTVSIYHLIIYNYECLYFGKRFVYIQPVLLINNMVL